MLNYIQYEVVFVVYCQIFWLKFLVVVISILLTFLHVNLYIFAYLYMCECVYVNVIYIFDLVHN